MANKLYTKIELRVRNWYARQIILRTIINCIITKAGKRQWYLNLGAVLLKKGVGYEIGQVIDKVKINSNQYKITYITGFSYDFEKNKVIHRTGVKICEVNEKGR